MYDKVREAPGLLEEIGSEARGILFDDYLAASQTENAAASGQDFSFSVGMTPYHPENIAKLLLRGRLANSSLFLNATSLTTDQNMIENSVVSQINFYNVLGPNSTASIYIPYPCENERVLERLEIHYLHQKAGITSSIRSGPPHAELSVLLGTYLLAVGGKVNVNINNQEVNYTSGGTFRTDAFSVGLLTHKKGQIKSAEATVCTKFENNASIACRASHSFVGLPWAQTSRVSVGVSYPIPTAEGSSIN